VSVAGLVAFIAHRVWHADSPQLNTARQALAAHLVRQANPDVGGRLASSDADAYITTAPKAGDHPHEPLPLTKSLVVAGNHQQQHNMPAVGISWWSSCGRQMVHLLCNSACDAVNRKMRKSCRKDRNEC
jgi:hypothetical protein